MIIEIIKKVIPQQILCLLVIFWITSGCSPEIIFLDLQTELRSNPVGVDLANPRLSWKIRVEENNIRQEAYQIVVAKSREDLYHEKKLVWNTGKIKSDKSTFIQYQGEDLESRQEYFWKVKVWTNKGKSDWSNINSWRMAFLEETDWNASWIGLDSLTNKGEELYDVVNTRLSARYLRKEFNLKENVRSAHLYICGLGMYECYINGEKIGADIFSPTATDYTKHVYYNCYDVSEHLQSSNAIGVVLGNGRYFTVRNKLDERYGVPPAKHFGFPKLLMQMEIEYENGETQTIVSDASWKLNLRGPIVSNNEFDGEEYDSRLEFQGWTNHSFDDRNWIEAEKVEEPGGKLIAQRNPNIRTMKEIKPVSITKLNGKYIVDMGQNMVGWLKVHLYGTKDNAVVMRFAETLNDDGSLYMDNLRGAKVTNRYTPKVDGVFEWNPTFTYQGFRYAEISGIDSMPRLKDLTGQVNYDEMKTIGEFETSNQTLNQIYKNAVWGIMGNYRSFPTDCPQRDERMPWLGDRATGSYGESFIFDHTLLYEKWLQDIEDSQRESGSLPDVAPNYWPFYSDNITWPAAYIFAANMLFEQRGDQRPLKNHYSSMKRWLEYMSSNYMEDYILTKDVYGDWCMPPESLDLIHSKDPERITDGGLMSTSFYYHLLNRMSRFASILDKKQDEQYFKQQAQKVKEAYNKTFLNKEKGCYDNNTVTANLISLMHGLVPSEYQETVFYNMTERIEVRDSSHVGVGLIGIQYLMRGLNAYGRNDLAYKIASNETYPSWGYMVKNGATTIWELWNGNTANPAMNSGNHVMLLGDYLIWCYENLAGIKTDKEDVGFKKIIMKPDFNVDLNYVKAKTETPYGIVKSEWDKSENSINWKVEIPANSSAILYIPAENGSQILVDNKVFQDNDDMQVLNKNNNLLCINVNSGRYSFSIRF